MSDEPQITDAELQAYADGRLAEERSRAVEAWLAARPDDAERIAAYRRLGEELRRAYDPVLDEPLPEWLSDARGPRPRWQGFARVAGWVALGAALGAIAGWELRDARPVAASRGDLGAVMARRAAVAHATYSPEVRHPVEVGADQEAHLVAWLSKRLGTQLRAPKLESVGYSLVGGRLLPGDNGPVAHFMYQSSQGHAHHALRALRHDRQPRDRFPLRARRQRRRLLLGRQQGRLRDFLGRHQQGRAARHRQRRLPAAQSALAYEMTSALPHGERGLDLAQLVLGR